jgi:hypothetical protein
MAWTDERLQDRFDSIDRRFDSVDHRFDRVDGELLELRREMNAGFAAQRLEQLAMNEGLRGEIEALRKAMYGFGAALVAAVVVSSLIQG